MDINLKKGYELRLVGEVPSGATPKQVPVSEVAIVPDDFPGLTPKLEAKEGDVVKRGQPLFHDKTYEQVKVCSPAAGRVKSIVRGERRKIERIVLEVLPDSPLALVANAANRQESLDLLCAGGMLARMRQRPYDIVPRPDRVPRDIFITAIDSAPLALSLSDMVKDKLNYIKAGVELLSRLTDGKVYLSIDQNWTLGNIPGAEMVTMHGKHPVGNVGVQIANIRPVNKGEVVWTLDAVTLAKIGALAITGHVETSTIVAITGSEAVNPGLVSTVEGGDLRDILAGHLSKQGHIRIISGNVLTGVAETADGYLRFPYRQITIIPEGDNADEFMGWASLSPSKMSASHAFLSAFGNRRFKPDARLLGGRRAMIMSGQYDKMIPMDIMPEFLIKAILAKDIDQMEKLGIYEVAPEDFALAEWADTSKLPLQQIVREGLNYLRKEIE